MSNYFDKAIFSCSANLRKPDSEIYRLICRELNVQPTECYYVGDWSEELIGANMLEMTAIQICSKEDKERDASWDGRKIFDIEELLDIIR